MISFEAKLLSIGKYTIIRLPDDVSTQLSSRGQVMVKGKIGGHSLEQVLEPDGDWGHWFKLDNKLQENLGLKVGDSVNIDISPSKDWPEPKIPEDFSQALKTAPQKVKQLWVKITPMARWEWVRWINATGNLDTRARRVEVSISKLNSGKRRPCCFNLAMCTDPELSKNGRLLEI